MCERRGRGLKFCLKHDSTGRGGGRGENVKQCDLRKARDTGNGMRRIKGIVHF